MMGKHWFLTLALLIPASTLLASNMLPSAAPELPWESIQASHRDVVRDVVGRASLSARGPKETFPCRPEQYFWFLDHPDRAVVAWQRLGAKCVAITPRAEGVFGWNDENGSEVNWETVYRGTQERIWFAEGKVKPGPLLPAVPVKVVVVMHHDAKQSGAVTIVHHQADLYMQTDSKSVALVTKMMGKSSHKIAENGLGQLQLFFSGLSWYLNRYPEKAEELLRN